ncbi:MAG: chromophore lyase CpcT/CpeT [Phycisphaerales bacterium]
MMIGTFDSRDQSVADDAFLPIRLVMLPIDIADHSGTWLYVEQALVSTPGQPYRQRVYHVHRVDGSIFASDVYTFAGDPADFVQGWNTAAGLPEIRRDMLQLRDGCSIRLSEQRPGTFMGATDGSGCASSLGEAAYATSEVVVQDGMISSWDRGWTATGEQAWGAVSGPYRFVRRSRGAPSAG